MTLSFYGVYSPVKIRIGQCGHFLQAQHSELSVTGPFVVIFYILLYVMIESLD